MTLSGLPLPFLFCRARQTIGGRFQKSVMIVKKQNLFQKYKGTLAVLAVVGACDSPVGVNIKLQIIPWLIGWLWFAASATPPPIVLLLFLSLGFVPLHGLEQLAWGAYVTVKVVGFWGFSCWLRTLTARDIVAPLKSILCVAILVFFIAVFFANAVEIKPVGDFDIPRVAGINRGGLHSAAVYAMFSLVALAVGLKRIALAFAALCLVGSSYMATIALVLSAGIMRCRSLGVARLASLLILVISIAYPVFSFFYDSLPEKLQCQLVYASNSRTPYQHLYAKYAMGEFFGLGNQSGNDYLRHVLDSPDAKEYMAFISERYSKYIERKRGKTDDGMQEQEYSPYLEFLTRTTPPHNLLIAIIVQYGFLGGGVFVVMLAALLRSIWNMPQYAHALWFYALAYHIVNDFHYFIFFFSLGVCHMVLWEEDVPKVL